MINFIKKTLLTLIFINFIVLLFLLNIKDRFFVKNPELGTSFNEIIKNDKFCKQFSGKINNIFEFAGKSLILNVYSIDDNKYTKNFDLIDRIIEEKLNVNIIDIILFKDKNENKVIDFILKNKINRPVFYIKKSFFNKKFSLNSNSILISDPNINDFVELNKFNYNKIEDVVKNFYKKTKKIRADLITKSTKLNNDELLIKSIKNILIINNDKDDNELFFMDEIDNSIFGTYANGNLSYYIGSGKNNEGLLQNIYFKNIKSMKYYENYLYILDDIYIKKLDVKNNVLNVVLKEDLIKDCVDFDIVDKNKFILFNKFGDIILNKKERFKILKSNFSNNIKFKRYNNKLYLLDNSKSKIYQLEDDEFIEFLNLNNLINNISTVNFVMQNKLFYLLDSVGNLYIVKDKEILQIKHFSNISNILDINIDNNNLYLSNGSNLYKVSLTEINKKNSQVYLNKIDFKFSYKSQNYFSKKEFDFSKTSKEILSKDEKLKISINNNIINKSNIFNYIDLYEIKDNKIIYLKEGNILDRNIIFDDIDSNKDYYLNGKIYYKYNDEIFVKKINSFISFKENHINNNVEINFNNIYIN